MHSSAMGLISLYSCPSCGSQETLRVTMTLAGSATSFTSCPVCEWKGWEREGQNVPLGSVLGLVANR
jgi:DNA polymerase III alpha subunit (gram-positive type)